MELLPPIRKTILYLDQFAISNFIYLANPTLDEERTDRASRWASVFDAVTALVGAQALVCPSSGFHTDESLARLHDDCFMSALDQLQLSLSMGVGLPDAINIEIRQLRSAAALSGEGEVDAGDARLLPPVDYSSDPHQWASTFQVGVATSTFYSGVVDEVQGSLNSQGLALQQAFESWQGRTTDEIADQFELELASYGPAILRAAVEAMQSTLTDPLAALNQSIQRLNAIAAQYAGRASYEDGYESAVAFLLGDAVKEVPKCRIGASMYAVLARLAASGMRSVEPSFATDLAVVSSLLPYCDGIAVDGRCAEVLRQPPARNEVDRWHTTVLSARDLDGFRAWLDAVASSVPSDHLTRVEHVYGSRPVNHFRKVFSA